ncbi:MFS transporter [Pseudonocardia alaniniphila]|uniref:MFS transporter n=1 Tax=Pseudonocardia alaniniphila TaxID=75291 RepID=A0ABS9T7V8_9PSEU|nr:MFS transporter [Pseudonocardia alaniniphila]MCH6164624.1 MFS transporter [Pseudonocardia alaniniphila]
MSETGEEPPDPRPTPPRRVAERIDRLPVTRTHRRATVVVGLGLFFELYELFLTGVLSSVLLGEFGLTKAELALVLASTFIGMFVGALVLGPLADRLGRRSAFLLNLAVYSTFSLLGAFSMNAAWLVAIRFMAGVGLGAELPLADTYLTDLLPARHRGRYIARAYTVGFMGVPVVGFVARWITATSFVGVPGWRWMFVIGSLGAFIVLLLRRGLPESPRWLESVGRTEEAEAIAARLEDEAHDMPPEPARAIPDRVPAAVPAPAAPAVRTGMGALFARPYNKRTGMMVVFHVFQTVGYYGFGTMVPVVLTAKGYPISESLLYAGLTYLGYPIGSALSLPLVEAVERKTLVVSSGLAMAAFGLAFGFSNTMLLIVAWGFLYTAVSNVFSNAYHIYQAEIFPTPLRSTGASGTYALSRLVIAIMPFVLVPVLKDDGAAPLLAIMCVAMVVVAVDVSVLGPRTTGRRLEAVNA